MANFLVLYHGDGISDSEDGLESREMVSIMNKWSREIGSCLIDGGSPTLGGRIVTQSSIKPSGKDPVTSYCVLEAESLEQAIELSRGAPPLYDGGRAEVYKIADAVY